MYPDSSYMYTMYFDQFSDQKLQNNSTYLNIILYVKWYNTFKESRLGLIPYNSFQS
jgi:hypothetical protein